MFVMRAIKMLMVESLPHLNISFDFQGSVDLGSTEAKMILRNLVDGHFWQPRESLEIAAALSFQTTKCLHLIVVLQH